MVVAEFLQQLGFPSRFILDPVAAQPMSRERLPGGQHNNITTLSHLANFENTYQAARRAQVLGS